MSDLHYTLRQLDWVVSVAGEYELVIVAGDHLDIGSLVEPDAQIAVVLEYFSRLAAKTSVIACSGNHDLNADNEHRRAVGAMARSGRRRRRRCRRHACAHRRGARDRVPVVGRSAPPRDVVDRQLAADATLVGDRQWIWVYHAPPDSSPTSWTGKRHYGDAELVAWIEQHRPSIVLCGHVHESPFASGGAWMDRIGSTLVFNAGRRAGPIPTCIELDINAESARWSSLAGVEERRFAEV